MLLFEDKKQILPLSKLRICLGKDKFIFKGVIREGPRRTTKFFYFRIHRNLILLNVKMAFKAPARRYVCSQRL